MPTPARTSLAEIISAGRALVESEGLDGLTMQKVAAAVGVRGPSLYKRVPSRAELIRLIAGDVVDDLARRLEQAVAGVDPRQDLSALAHALRAFAHEQPGAYRLIFAAVPAEWRVPPDRVAEASDAVVRTAAALAGPDRALEAARTFTAWSYGFLAMELAGAFQLGGGVDEAFAFGVERLGEALSR